MLKSILTETGIHLELLNIDIEDWLSQRCAFAASTGEAFATRAGRAAIPLPAASSDTDVAAELARVGAESVTVCRCDSDWLEIEFTHGYWIDGKSDVDEDFGQGVFVSQLSPQVETYLWQLWYAANRCLVAGDGVMG